MTPEPTPEPVSVLGALHSTPARRYLAPDPIPDEVPWAVLHAATRGPSGGDAQDVVHRNRWGATRRRAEGDR